MILVAKDADFSQNNLGQIDLPYSDLTTSVMAKFTKSLTDPQKKALNTLLIKVENAGILAKQKHFYLPILAGTLAESFINIADPLLPTEVTPNAAYYALKTGGFYNSNPNAIEAAKLPLTLKSGMTTTDFHLLQFNTENIVVAQDAVITHGNLVAYTTLLVSSGKLVVVTNFNLMNISPTLFSRLPVGSNELLNLGLSKTLKGFSFMQNDKLKSYSPTETSVTLTSSYTSENISGVLNLSGYNNNSILKSNGLISIGKGLTSAEITLLSNAANNFMTAMGVIL